MPAPQVLFPTFLLLTVALLGVVVYTGIKAKLRLHITFVVLTVLGAAAIIGTPDSGGLVTRAVSLSESQRGLLGRRQRRLGRRRLGPRRRQRGERRQQKRARAGRARNQRHPALWNVS